MIMTIEISEKLTRAWKELPRPTLQHIADEHDITLRVVNKIIKGESIRIQSCDTNKVKRDILKAFADSLEFKNELIQLTERINQLIKK